MKTKSKNPLAPKRKWTKKSAGDFLISTGIYTKNGKLKKEYGG